MSKLKLIDKQIQDSLRIMDCLFRTMSNAENIALGEAKHKKYAKYDETNVCSWKKEEQIIDDFLMNIECLNTMINIYKKRHNGRKFKYPKDQPKENILYDLQNFKKIIGQNCPRIIPYYDDLKKLIEGENCKRYTEKELLGTCKNDAPIDEKKANKIGFNILNGVSLEEKRMKKKLEKYDKQGEMVEDLDERDDDYYNDEDDYLEYV